MKPFRKMMKVATRYILSILIFLCVAAGCKKTPVIMPETEDDRILVSVGDSSLTMSDVLPRIPSGLAPEDSAALFSAIVDAWVERLLLEDFGKENIEDMDRINRLTAEYRSRLIAESYRRSIRNKRSSKVIPDSVESYYQSHKSDLTLERPLVKGVFLKLPSDVSNLKQIRQWVFGGRPQDIDNLENNGLAEAYQYSFFQDRWIDWQTVADQIPSRFDNPDGFVAANKNFETTHGGTTYLLHISSFMKSGQPMPMEFARPFVEEILDNQSAASYEQQLIERLYVQAKKDGKLKAVNYDPVTHSMLDGKGKQTIK